MAGLEPSAKVMVSRAEHSEKVDSSMVLRPEGMTREVMPVRWKAPLRMVGLEPSAKRTALRAALEAKADTPIIFRPKGRATSTMPVAMKAADPTIARREPSAKVMVLMELQKAKVASPMLATEAGKRRDTVLRAEVQKHSVSGLEKHLGGQLLKTVMVPLGMVSVPSTP